MQSNPPFSALPHSLVRTKNAQFNISTSSFPDPTIQIQYLQFGPKIQRSCCSVGPPDRLERCLIGERFNQKEGSRSHGLSTATCPRGTTFWVGSVRPDDGIFIVVYVRQVLLVVFISVFNQLWVGCHVFTWVHLISLKGNQRRGWDSKHSIISLKSTIIQETSKSY